MKREFLKGLGLSDDTINTIMAEHGKDIEELKTTNSQLQSDLEGKNAIIKNNSTDFDKRVNEQVDKIRKEMIVDNAIKDKFKDVPDKYRNLILTQIDRSKISLDDKGNIQGLDDQYTSLNEAYKDLFTNQQGPNGGTGLPNGGTPNPNSNKYDGLDYESYKKERLKEMEGENN